jgi:hypothetical protein
MVKVPNNAAPPASAVAGNAGVTSLADLFAVGAGRLVRASLSHRPTTTTPNCEAAT